MDAINQLFSKQVGVSLNFTVGAVLADLATALVLGFIISMVYMITHKRVGYSTGFMTSLIMLPAIISIIILLVGNNVARAFGVAGAFSLVRFRSEPGQPRDIAYIFFTVAIGLACGVGYLFYGALFTVLLSAVLLVLNAIRFANTNARRMNLKITIPENLNYNGLFDDILNEYTKTWTFSKIRTTEFGTLLELQYAVVANEDFQSKAFIDKLRTRNGNLNITLTLDIDED